MAAYYRGVPICNTSPLTRSKLMTRGTIVFVVLWFLSSAAGAQKKAPERSPAKAPQGPAKLVIDWDATILLEVLPAEPSAPGSIRLRTKYEKSTAHVTSDTFDPAAAATEEQYQNLEGKAVEFTLDANGKVISVSGLEEIVDGEKTVEAARDWIAQLSAGSGAPAGGVIVGQKWFSEQPAASLPVAEMVWRTESEYLRDEICRPPNPDAAPTPSSAESAGNPESAEACAVILTRLNLVRHKPVRDVTPEEYRKSGVQTAGKWDGSAESLSYISLRTICTGNNPVKPDSSATYR